MMRWMLGMLLGVFTTLLAQVPNQEVVLSASAGSRVGVAFPAPQVAGLDAGLVNRELRDVVVSDLDDAGPFSVITKSLPASTEPPAYPAWVQTGTDWLLVCRVSA